MKNIIALLPLTILAALLACSISNPVAPTTPNQGCPPNATCQTVVPSDPSPTRTPTLTDTPVPTATGIPIVTPAAGSRYYYVSTEGNDARPGTKLLPFHSIGQAAKVARAGDVVLIQAGIYEEDVKPCIQGTRKIHHLSE